MTLVKSKDAEVENFLLYLIIGALKYYINMEYMYLLEK